MSNLIAQTPLTAHTETGTYFQKVTVPSAFRQKGLFGVFFLEEHFLQQTFLPNNSTCHTAAGKSQPTCEKAPRASEHQWNDKYLKYHKAMERDHRAEICDRRETSAFCPEGACSALVPLERSAVRLPTHRLVSRKRACMSQWPSHSEPL